MPGWEGIGTTCVKCPEDFFNSESNGTCQMLAAERSGDGKPILLSSSESGTQFKQNVGRCQEKYWTPMDTIPFTLRKCPKDSKSPRASTSPDACSCPSGQEIFSRNDTLQCPGEIFFKVEQQKHGSSDINISIGIHRYP